MSPVVPRPLSSVVEVLVFDGVCTCTVGVWGAGCGSGASGLLCARAAAAGAAASMRTARTSARRMGGNLALERPRQRHRVADRERLPVVVEVREDLAPVREL